MRKNLLLKGIVASLMLFIFMFSIMPRFFLHNCLAAHKDACGTVKVNGQNYLGYVIYNCNDDNIVVKSPFTQEDNQFNIKVRNAFTLQQGTQLPFFYSRNHFFFCLRGPPAVS